MWPFASKADVHKEIEAAQQSLLTQIRQIIPQQTIAPPPTPPVQDFVLYNKLDQFQRQLDSLSKTVNQVMPVTPTGELKPIQERIEIHLLAATKALEQLRQEHATWTQEQKRYLDTMKPTLEALTKQHDDAVQHVLPDNQEEVKTNTGPITQV